MFISSRNTALRVRLRFRLRSCCFMTVIVPATPYSHHSGLSGV
jgi:hypothetical protein